MDQEELAQMEALINSGFSLLGRVIEVVTGETFEAALERGIGDRLTWGTARRQLRQCVRALSRAR